MGFPDNFEQTLKKFFFKYHPRKAEKIPAIVKEFKGSEKEVMLLLCKRYGVDPNTIDGLMSYQPPVSAPAPIAPAKTEKAEAIADEQDEQDEEPEKSED